MSKNIIPPPRIGCDFICKEYEPPVESRITYYSCNHMGENREVGNPGESRKQVSTKNIEHWSVNTEVTTENEYAVYKKGEIFAMLNPLHFYTCAAHYRRNQYKAYNPKADLYTILMSYGYSQKYTPPCNTTPAPVPLTTIQSKCTGHISRGPLNGQDLNEYTFPEITYGKNITADDWNLVLDQLKIQINKRMASHKYQKIYGALPPDEHPLTLAEEAHAPLLDGKIYKSLHLDKILKSIKNLQPKHLITSKDEFEFKFDRHNSSQQKRHPSWLLSNRPIALPYDGQPSKTIKIETKNIFDKPLLLKQTMDLIINAIKDDISDCICYSDCNGYQVCWCHGNCNFGV